MIRIATWNVQRPTDADRRALLSDSMRRHAADVWVLTETHDELTPGDGYAKVSTPPTTDRRAEPAERWTTIWSRHTVVETPETSDPERAVVAVVAPRSAPRLVIYGTVLPWGGSSWRGVDGKDSAAFREALAVQAEDWKRLRDRYPDAVLCVAGDLNQDLHSSPYYQSRSAGEALRAALGSVGLEGYAVGENDPVAALTEGARASIDHILLPSGVSVRRFGAWPEARLPDRTLSDHYGLWMDVDLGASAG